MIRKTNFFVDGENLVMRYQAMVESGRTPLSDVIHIPDTFVWSPAILSDHWADISRVTYYTSMVGDDGALAEAQRIITSCRYTFVDGKLQGTGRLVPRIFKKVKQSKKSPAVDINIVIDAMRCVANNDVNSLSIMSGDSDFIPLIEEVMRQGRHCEVFSLSSGLHDRLEYLADDFQLLDNRLFKHEKTNFRINALPKPDGTKTSNPQDPNNPDGS